MGYPNLEDMFPNSLYHERIHPRVWLMDDHRWAFYAWEKSLPMDGIAKPCSLVHLDYHWDGVNDFQAMDVEGGLRAMDDLDEIYLLVSENKLVRKDSFIAPAVIRRLVHDVHFLCFQRETEPGLDEALVERHGVEQHIHSNLNSLLARAPQGSLIDIDLDIFQRSTDCNRSDVWAEPEIVDFIMACTPLIRSSPLVTIAMSSLYSGTNDDTRYLTRLVVPRILDIVCS